MNQPLMAGGTLLARARAERGEQAVLEERSRCQQDEFRYNRLSGELFTLLADVLGVNREGMVLQAREFDVGDDQPLLADQPVAEIDGLMFSIAHYHTQAHLMLVRPCPDCGALVMSKSIYGLAQLADAVEQPVLHFRCPARAAPPPPAPAPVTPEQRLLDALRDFVARHAPGCGCGPDA